MARPALPAVLLAGVVAVWALLAFVPAESLPGIPCLVRQTTGVHCPGCGGTRAARHLAQGHWAFAARSNVLIYPVVLAVLWSIIVLAANRWRHKNWWHPLKLGRRSMWILLALATVFTVARNLEAAWFLRP